ncbi:EVE domain-containing protein [Streptomyces sp. NPDC006235]|uniref:EVE domain-containing protein n=1 Tax=Streptomyces sp. NPDC006235 TaxID=3156736 RepID=UPI0033AAAB86
MPVNRWWRHDPLERFWLEITNRDDIGTNLLAPQVNDRGEEYWSYALVREARPGDLVLHWDKNHGPGVVGYSHVRGEAFASTITWQSRGTYGRQRRTSGPEPAWEAPLGGYRRLKHPVTQARLREIEPTIRALRDHLAEAVDGVIDQIELDDDLRCHGGRWRTWTEWTPRREELVATAYRYPLPEGGHPGRPSA